MLTNMILRDHCTAAARTMYSLHTCHVHVHVHVVYMYLYLCISAFQQQL